METLSVTVHKQPWICVLDPILMLCSRGLQGVGLTRQLGQSMELWVVRELWHILDDTPLYLSQGYAAPGYDVTSDLLSTPNFSLASPLASRSIPDTTQAETPPPLPLIDRRSLQAWSQIRQTTDLGGYHFYWMGDALSQSRLPDWIKQGKPTHSSLQQYELLAQSLEASTSSEVVGIHQPLVSACRDAAALAAALGSSFILAAQQQSNEPPYIVQYLEHWGIPCQQRPASDAVVTIEKHLLQQLFVQSGLAKLLWSDTLHLAIVHLNVPASFDPNLVLEDASDEDDDDSSGFSAEPERPWELENIPFAGAHLWDGTQVFWYPLTRHTTMATAYADSTAIAREAIR
ncbi:MAG: hypothetical protein AAFV85_15920 [Cyanobacteria bacterium J06634_6]